MPSVLLSENARRGASEMTAPLYHWASGMVWRANPDREDVCGSDARVEADVIPLAAPVVGLVGEDIVGLDGLGRSGAPVLERQLDPSVLHAERIQVDDDEHDVGRVFGPLAVADQ